MANVSKTIDIIFNGKDFVSKSVGKITKSINKITTAIEDVAEPVARTVDKLIKMEAALVAVGTAISALSLGAFKSYQYALIDLKKVLEDDEIPLLGEFERRFEDLAITYGVSVNEIIKSTTDFKRAGFELDGAFKLVNRAMELSSAGMVDMETSTNNIIAVMKGFELEVEDATHLIDAINIVSDRYATNATELSDALRRVAPAAKLAGLSIDETIGVVTPAIEVFRSGEEASTAWRRGLVKLVDDAKPVAESLRRLGVAQKTSTGELRSGRDILIDLSAALRKTTTSQQLFSLGQIFGSRQVAKVITALRDWNYVMEIENVSALVKHDYTMKQVQQRWASLEVQLGSARSAIEIAAIALGSKLEPAAAKVLSAVTELFSSFDDNLREGAFDTLFNLLDNFGERIRDYLVQVGQDLPKALQDIDYSNLLKAFRGLFGEIQEILDRFQLDTPEGLRKFLQDVSDTTTGIVNATTGLIDTFDKFAIKIAEIVKGFRELNPEQQKFIGRSAGWAKLIDEFGVKGLATFEALNLTASNFSGIMTTMSGVVRHLAGVFELFFLPTTASFQYLHGTISSVVSLLRGDVNEAWKTFSDSGSTALKSLTRGFKNLTGGLDTVHKGLNDLSSSMNSASNKIESRARKLADEMSSALKESIKSQEDSFDDFQLTVLDGFDNIPSMVKSNSDRMAEYWEEDIARMRESTKRETDELIKSLDLKDEIHELNKSSYTEFENLLNWWDKRGGRPFYVDKKRKKEWDEYKKSLVSTARETSSRVQQEELYLDEWQDKRDSERLRKVQDTGKKITKFYGTFTNESLELFKGIVPGLEEYDKQMSEALDQEDAELDVPDDTKFKAAQQKLLKEIDTNADIMEASLRASADVIEARSEVISSAFESINSSIEGTGDTLTQLYSELSSGRLDIATQSKIQRQISTEEERRQEAFDLQKQLTTAQIDLIKQRASAMAAGDPLITVSGDGLQPHLEAFMWEILSAIQVRVNEDYGSFLLGIGAT